MSELYKGMPGSPITYLASDISAGQTTISVADDTALPDAPNICTIGYGEEIETIKYVTKSNGVLQNVTRGIEGAPRAWQTGTEVARFFTAYDHDAIAEDIINLDTKTMSHLADIVQTTEVNSSTKYPSAAVTYGLGQKLDKFRVVTGLVNTGLISQSSTTEQLISAMPVGSIVSFSHLNEHAVKLTDLPQNYGQVFLVKSAYTLGFFSATNGYMFRWNLSTKAWVTM